MDYTLGEWGGMGKKGVSLLTIVAMVLSISTPLILFPTAASAASLGPISPGTVTTSGSGVSWNNSNNIKIYNDGIEATASLDNGESSKYIKATNFGFAIPAGATIDGISVEIQRREQNSGASIQDNSVKIIKSDSTLGTAEKALSGEWSNFTEIKNYGGVSDKWLESWSATDINSPNFGVAVSAKKTSGGSTKIAYLDSVRITVYYTIIKIDQIITTPVGNPASAVYGSTFTAATTTATPSGLPATITVTGGCTISAGIVTMTSGTVACVIHYNQAGNDTYNAAPEITQTVTASPKPITVTANSGQTKVYGGTDPVFTYTNDALVGSDTLTGALDRVAGENVGGYAIGQGTLTAGTNYAITFVPAEFSITQKAVTVTADAKSKIVGNSDPTLTYQITSGSLVGTDSFSGTLDRVAGEDVGTYAIGQGTLTLGGNYNLSYIGANLTITDKIVINVTAEAKSKTYGQTDPELTYTFTPALQGTDAFSGALARTAGENAGTYAITQGTLSLSTDYVINFTGADFVINKKAITVTAVTDSKVYDGTTASAGVPTTGEGDIVSGDTPNFTQTFDTKHVGSGKTLTPTGTAGGNDGNNYTYTFVAVSSGTITALPVTVTAVTSTKVFDGNTSSSGVPTIAPALATGDTSNFTQTFDTATVGTGKTLTPAGTITDGNEGANYTITFVNNTTGSITETAPITHTLTYTAGANGTITGTSPQTVNDGASGTAVTATGNAGFHFTNWSDESSANPRTDAAVTTDISVTANFAPDPTPAPAPAPAGRGGGGSVARVYMPGDINQDGHVDELDFAILLSDWGKTGIMMSDINHDGIVDSMDLAILMFNWGK